MKSSFFQLKPFIFYMALCHSVFGNDKDIVKYEAEDAVLHQLRNESNHKGFSGTGFVGGFYNNANGLVTFNVNAKQAGKENLTLRYSAGHGQAKLVFGVNGQNQDVDMASTKGWTAWSHRTVPVELKQGENTITLKMKTSSTDCINLDYLVVGELLEESLRDAFANPGQWENIAEVKAENKKLLVIKEGEGLLINGRKGKCNNILTKKYYKDIAFHLEFMLAKNSNAGVYFMGRYEIQIFDSYGKGKWGFADLGGLYQRWPPARGAGVAAKVNASKKPGEWQTMDVVFRAPRFDEDGIRTAQAFFKEVRINGQLVQENLYAVGPTRSSKFNDEAAIGPIMIQGDHGPIVIRKMTVKEVDLSHIQTKALSDKESMPLGKNGLPMVEFVSMGKDVFLNKGCIECHDTSGDEGVVKTGPSLFRTFQKNAVNVKVLESAEQHIVEIPFDKDYLNQSLREPTAHLSFNTDNKPYLPIMPPFLPDILKDSEIEALYYYLMTLNPESVRGPKVVWRNKMSDQYNLWKDRGSVIVQDRVRVQRAPIYGNSARAIYVGLPGNVNYSFDPQSFGISMVWNGPFVSINGVMDGRGKIGQLGSKAIRWNEGGPELFRPYLKNGKVVDHSIKEPKFATGQYIQAALNDSSDYVKKVNALETKFIGLSTDKESPPQFSYEVEGNHVDIRFVPLNENKITAAFNLKLKHEQSFTFPSIKFKDVTFSIGEIKGDKWTLPAGDHNDVIFTATRKSKFKKVYTAGENDIPSENLKGQKLEWVKASDKEQKAAGLHSNYTLHNINVPKDTYGRTQLFEPLAIGFFNKGIAYVSTRTAGVWKVVGDEWHLFSEGHYDSLGLVIESENTIVIGEKTGLTRLTDKDGDHWADERENLSDQFRFCGNYHEYLHGPISYKGGYLYNLNLTHQLPANYKAGGMYMGTGGGLRGWMCRVDKKGNFSTFANGFRSPAGLSLSPGAEIVYTENQGEYVGTSKVYTVKEGGFYGNPTGLVDIPGMTPQNSEIQWESMKDKCELAMILLPHNEVMNAPGNPTWDKTKGAFGPFAGQMFLGDQTQSCIYRIDTEKVKGVAQGVAIPFADKLASGVMRLTFSPKDNSLWVGQTGRGWRSRGGAESSLQRITFEGGVPNAIKTVKVTAKGFDVHFTLPQTIENFGTIACESWFYNDSPNYGSKELGKRQEAIDSTTWSADKKTCSIAFSSFVLESTEDNTNTSRVYRLDLKNTLFGKAVGPFLAKAYYTLNAIPNKDD